MADFRSLHRFVFGTMFALGATFLETDTGRAGTVADATCIDRNESVAPTGEGPLEFIKVQCLLHPTDANGAVSPAILSPEGNAFFLMGGDGELWLGNIDPPLLLKRFQAGVAGFFQLDFSRPFAWFEDGRSVLAVTQDVMKPLGGWALGPLKPFLASIDGTSRSLPPLDDKLGSLDEIHWIGHAGLAVALLGGRGPYYRPPHDDPHPAIALIDAIAGRVIQTSLLADLVPDASLIHIVFVSWRTDEDGIAEALMVLAPNRWIRWKLGEKPSRVPIDIKNRLSVVFAFSPDGRTVLVMRALSATGMICEHDPNCPPPIPKTGAIAELYNASSGQILWSIIGTATNFTNDGVPAISPDGRFAVISMPVKGRGYTVGLVAMATGEVLQEVPSSGPLHSNVDFSSDSQAVRVSNQRQVVTYRIKQ